MSADTVTIPKRFSIDTENQLHLPRKYDDSRRWPLIVGLHGMGQTAPEFSELLRPLRRLPAMLLVPEGVYPFEIRTGPRMRVGRAWYLYTGDESGFVRSMERSGRHLRSLIERVSREYPVDPDRVFLLGFSQGGYFAGYWSVRHARRFRGAIVIGARVKDEVLERELERAKDLSLLLLHGTRDRAVPFPLAERSYQAVKAAGVDVKLRTYDSGHSLSKQQLADAAKWLRRRF